MVGFSSGLLLRCHNTLRQCSEFDNSRSLRSVFMTSYLKPYRDRLPDADNKADRVGVTIDYLISRPTGGDQFVFLLFLIELARRRLEGDALRDELERLRIDVEHELKIYRPPKPIPKQRVQLYLHGDFSSLTPARRSSTIDALAGLLQISPNIIEIHSVHEGSVVFDLGIPSDAIQHLRFLLQSNNSQLRLLKIEKVILETKSGDIEEWGFREGKFDLVSPTKPSLPDSTREEHERGFKIAKPVTNLSESYFKKESFHLKFSNRETEIIHRCLDVLGRYSQFDSRQSLQAVFATEHLRPYRDDLPTTDSKTDLISQTIDYLLPRQTDDGQFVFPLFLETLAQRQPEGDLLREDLQRLRIDIESVLIPKKTDTSFHLKFANRKGEKEMIQKLVNGDFYVQIHAPGGVGKTYLLREIKRELEIQGWQTIWIDFASEQHRSCIADSFYFLQETAQQALGEKTLDLSSHRSQLDKAIGVVGRKLADLDKKIIIFLDNADRGDLRLLTWIREIFLVELSDWNSNIRMVATGQHPIPEWQGYSSKGRPFQKVELSGFDDSLILSEVLEDSANHFGAKQVKIRMNTEPEIWRNDLAIMVEGLYQVTRGHPLAIERVLQYAIEQDGLMHPAFFVERQDEIYRQCLVPIIGERILPTLDGSIREAFRSVCIFRYIWGGLIHHLINPGASPQFSNSWEPFSVSGRKWDHWWTDFQNTHLIYDPDIRQMHPVSPVIRQVIALVLKSEDIQQYQTQNHLARQIHENLLADRKVSLLRRAACLPEILFHATQDGVLSPADAPTVFIQTLTDFMDEFTGTMEFIEATAQLLKWLRGDAELREAVDQFAKKELFNQLVGTVQKYIEDWKGKNNV